MLGLWFAPIGLAASYYFIPKALGKPSVMMVIPVFAVAVNQHKTVLGNFHALVYSPTLRFIVLSTMITPPLQYRARSKRCVRSTLAGA